MPDTWHIWANSLQNPRATLSWTLREKLIHAQRLTVIPFIIFCVFKITINERWRTSNENLIMFDEWDLVHHIPLAYLWQAIFFLPSLVIFQLLTMQVRLTISWKSAAINIHVFAQYTHFTSIYDGTWCLKMLNIWVYRAKIWVWIATSRKLKQVNGGSFSPRELGEL